MNQDDLPPRLREIIGHPKDVTPLIDRERQILRLARAGYSTAQIGADLGYTPGTVRNMLSVIYAKLHVTNRLHALVVAERLRLLENGAA